MLSKKEIQKKLDELGVEYPSRATKEDLLALLEDAEGKSPATAGDESALEVPDDAEVRVTRAGAPSVRGDEVDILRGTNEYVRTFSKRVHGSRFKELAAMFCEKHRGCRIAKAGEVKALRVEWRQEEADEEGTIRFVTKSRVFTEKTDGADWKDKATTWKNQRQKGVAFVV